jgi:hypothetical protein
MLAHLALISIDIFSSSFEESDEGLDALRHSEEKLDWAIVRFGKVTGSSNGLWGFKYNS